MKVFIGIISWLPDNQDRKIRVSDLHRLLTQLNELWPTTPICILAQNWDDITIREIKKHNNITLTCTQRRMGILRARKALRKWLLSTDGDYFMLFDDDADIKCSNHANELLVQMMRDHPQGWAFSEHLREGQEPAKYNPFAHSQMSLCCLSRYIFAKEDFPNVDPEQSEAFEDRIYSMTIYCKYPELQFKIPYEIYSDHFRNGHPSTWSKRQKYNWTKMRENTEAIELNLLNTYNPKKSQ